MSGDESTPQNRRTLNDYRCIGSNEHRTTSPNDVDLPTVGGNNVTDEDDSVTSVPTG